MGVIQQGINQLLGTSAIVARLSPEYETKQELHKLNKQEEVLQKQSESAALKGQDTMDKDLHRGIANIIERKMELAERKFQLDPTEENFQSFVQSQKHYRNFNKMSDILSGQSRAQQKAAEQLQQKERFEKFKEMFTEGGKFK